jgi:23S rRNA pseudouridine1911/1915/1917 synthase
LHAYSLGFEHPTTHEWMQFESQFPEDFDNLLTKLRKFTNN